MRNTPLAFIAEDTVEQLGTVYRNRDRSAVIAHTVGVTTDAIADHWSDIERHKWHLSKRLGRDTGMEVAALDYFENVQRSYNSNRRSSFSNTWLGKVWQNLLENLDGDGPRSIVNLERALRHPGRPTA